MSVNLFLLRRDARVTCVEWISKNIEGKSIFGFGKMSLSKPRVFLLKKYKGIDLFYSRKRLSAYMPEYIILTDEDLLYNEYWYLKHLKRQYRIYEKRLHVDIVDIHRSFYYFIKKHYVLYKIFITATPLSFKYPEEIILETHPRVYFYKRK